MCNYRLKVTMFPNKLYGALRANFGDGIEVVAPKEDAEVDKLFGPLIVGIA